jgi:3-hydroxybutyryl-CoA dehydratase
MPQLSNYTYEEITIGQTASYTKRVEELDIQLFAAVSGDVNPVHLDADFAAGTIFGERIAHGMLTGAIISAALAMELPGPGTVYISQNLRFRLPVKIGDSITVLLEVTEKQDRRKIITLDCKASNDAGKLVATGMAQVMAAPEKILIDRPAVPQAEIKP